VREERIVKPVVGTCYICWERPWLSSVLMDIESSTDISTVPAIPYGLAQRPLPHVMNTRRHSSLVRRKGSTSIGRYI